MNEYEKYGKANLHNPALIRPLEELPLYKCSTFLGELDSSTPRVPRVFWVVAFEGWSLPKSLKNEETKNNAYWRHFFALVTTNSVHYQFSSLLKFRRVGSALRSSRRGQDSCSRIGREAIRGLPWKGPRTGPAPRDSDVLAFCKGSQCFMERLQTSKTTTLWKA